MNFVALLDQMSEHFFGTGGMAGAFAIYTVEDVGHGEGGVYRVGDRRAAERLFSGESYECEMRSRQAGEGRRYFATGSCKYRWAFK